MSQRLAALGVAGLFFSFPGELCGKDSIQEIPNHEEEACFEKGPQVSKQNPVQKICQVDWEDCVSAICQGTR
jgi:hypothetical protein